MDSGKNSVTEDFNGKKIENFTIVTLTPDNQKEVIAKLKENQAFLGILSEEGIFSPCPSKNHPSSLKEFEGN